MELHYSRSMPTLYGQLAKDVMDGIESGILKPGDRIASVRDASQKHGVSINTVKEAYKKLELQGYLESRPQSGYFVKRLPPPISRTEDAPLKPVDPRQHLICSIYGRSVEGIERNTVESLAVALPDTKLLPKEAIQESFRRVYRDYPHQSQGYTMPPGWKPLREEVARRLWDSGAKVQPEEVVITNGATEALYLAVRHFCRPGDTVVVETPTYFSFLQMLEAQGLKVLEIPGDPETGLNLDVLKYALERNTVRAAILIPTFSNPVGSLMPSGRKRELVEFLEEKEVPLIEDDTYGELAYDRSRPPTCLSFSKKGGVVLCGSISKTLSPGLRVGWLAAPKNHSAMEVLKTHANLGTATANQMVVADLLANGGYDRHLKKLCAVSSDYMAQMKECVFQNFPEGTRLSRPKGGYVLWVELPDEYSADALYLKAVSEGILFPPGSAFSTTDRFKNCLRLNAGTWGEETKAGVVRLGEILGQN